MHAYLRCLRLKVAAHLASLLGPGPGGASAGFWGSTRLSLADHAVILYKKLLGIALRT